MNGVAAEVAQEVPVLFQDKHLHTRPREQKAQHHSRRSTANNAAADLNRFSCHDVNLENFGILRDLWL